MRYLLAFVAGFVSTIVFHQGLLALLFFAGATDRRPYALDSRPPLGVPEFVSLAFWGGLWGIALWLVLERTETQAAYWTLAAVLGALGPSIVALFVVFPLKGEGVAGGWRPEIIGGALLLNAAWGLGVGLLMRLMGGLLANQP